MKAAVVIQARMGSQRLPGKVLRRIGGKPLLQYLVERLSRDNPTGQLIIATSISDADSALAEFCAELGVPCFRGSQENVADRFRGLVGQFGLDAFVRVSGDSPLLDAAIVQSCWERFLATGCDLATNVFPRTFPPGQSAEVVKTATFLRAYDRMREPEDFEHVTRFFYQHAEEFHIENVRREGAWPPMHLAVDTPEDLERCEEIVRRMSRPHWEYGLAEIAELYPRAASLSGR